VTNWNSARGRNPASVSGRNAGRKWAKSVEIARAKGRNLPSENRRNQAKRQVKSVGEYYNLFKYIGETPRIGESFIHFSNSFFLRCAHRNDDNLYGIPYIAFNLCSKRRIFSISPNVMCVE